MLNTAQWLELSDRLEKRRSKKTNGRREEPRRESHTRSSRSLAVCTLYTVPSRYTLQVVNTLHYLCLINDAKQSKQLERLFNVVCRRHGTESGPGVQVWEAPSLRCLQNTASPHTHTHRLRLHNPINSFSNTWIAICWHFKRNQCQTSWRRCYTLALCIHNARPFSWQLLKWI